MKFGEVWYATLGVEFSNWMSANSFTLPWTVSKCIFGMKVMSLVSSHSKKIASNQYGIVWWSHFNANLLLFESHMAVKPFESEFYLKKSFCLQISWHRHVRGAAYCLALYLKKENNKQVNSILR